MKDPDSFEVLACRHVVPGPVEDRALAGGAAYASTLLATLLCLLPNPAISPTRFVYAPTGSQRFDPHISARAR